MSYFCFSLLMLALFLVARFRAPMIGQLYAPWFFTSWFPSELPWAFGILQAAFTVLYLLFGDAFGGLDYLGLLITGATLWQWYGLHQKTFYAEHALKTALRKGLGENFEEELRTDLCIGAPSVIANGDWKKPFAFRRSGVQRLSDIAYGLHPRQRLDIYRPTASSDAKILRPVLLHVHGGAWIVGNKNQQGQPLMQYLTQNGWICIDINYRLAPTHRFPDALVDVKTAIAWLKDNIEAYGGDPEFIAITGGSAGGHLSSLAALTANHAQFQPGFEHSDTRVQAAVPMYGVYNFTATPREKASRELQKFLARYVMPVAYEQDIELWRSVSPHWHAREDIPPLFAIHGNNDCLAMVEDARDFVEALRTKSQAPVLYAELEGAQHGFEIFHAVRTEFTIEAVGKFLLHCYGKALAERDN
jgi:acetyl esterase/lipase